MKASTLSTVARPLLPPVWRKISTELKADAHQMNWQGKNYNGGKKEKRTWCFRQADFIDLYHEPILKTQKKNESMAFWLEH